MGVKGNRGKERKQLTTSDIISGYCSTVMRDRRQNKVYPNTYIGGWECDVLEVSSSGYTFEYEVKVSRADFNIDKLKHNADGVNKYDLLQLGKRVNYFSYVCPEGLISADEIPEWAGLVYAVSYVAQVITTGHNLVALDKVGFRVIKPPTKLSDDKITVEVQNRINECIYYRYHALREKLKRVYTTVRVARV